MKTLKPLLIAAIALALAYVLATVWVGHRVQLEMEEVAAALTARDDVRVTRFEYERGFGRGELRYDLVWQPVDADPALQPLIELGLIPADGFRLQGDLQVRQGPWVGGDAGFALGRTEGRIGLPDELRPLLPQYPGQEPLLRMTGIITFGGMIETHSRVIDYDGRVTPPDTEAAAELELTGLRAMTRTTPQLDAAVIDVRLDRARLGFNDGQGEVEMAGLFLEADAQEARPYLWTGTNSAGFDSIRVTAPDDLLALSDGRMSSETRLENDRINGTTTMTFGAARLDAYELQGGEMVVTVSNLDADALAAVSRLSNEYADTGGLPGTDEAVAEFMPYFERLLDGSVFAVEKLSVALQAPDDIVARMTMSVEGVADISLERLDVLARGIRATAELRLRQSALRYVSRLVAAEQLSDDATAADLDEAAAALYEMALGTLQELPFVTITEEEFSATAEIREGVLYAGETEVMNVEQTLVGMLAGMVAASSEMGGHGTLDPTAEPLYGRLELEYDFQPDPYPLELLAGGPDDLEMIIGEGCVGFVNGVRPDVVLSYSAGPNPLYIFGTSEFDTTLAVLDPAGQWHCNDDSFDRGLNPGVEFVEPLSGDYAIWIGTFDSDAVEALLTISELGMF